MNNVCLTGRLVRDVETRTTSTGKVTASFTVAVDRRFKTEGQPEADFIPCVVWGKIAEVCSQYLSKGSKVGVVGRIQTRSYDAKDGSKRYVTEVIAESVDFLESRKRQQESGGGQFGVNVPDDDVPF